MKIAPVLLAMSAAVASCGGGVVNSPDDPGYYNAEIKVVEMKYYLDDEGGREVFTIQQDGTVVANGKPVCRAVGTRIETPDGAMMVTIDADGNVTGPRAPPDARFNAKNQLVTRHAIVSMANREMVGASRRRGIDARPDDEAAHGEARMLLLWNNGNRVQIRGHYAIFNRRAVRLALLLGTLLLMKPGTLDNLPAAPP